MSTLDLKFFTNCSDSEGGDSKSTLQYDRLGFSSRSIVELTLLNYSARMEGGSLHLLVTTIFR